MIDKIDHDLDPMDRTERSNIMIYQIVWTDRSDRSYLDQMDRTDRSDRPLSLIHI